MRQLRIDMGSNQVIEFRCGIFRIPDKQLDHWLRHQLAHADHAEAFKEGIFGVVRVDDEELLGGIGKRTARAFRAKADGTKDALRNRHHLF